MSRHKRYDATTLRGWVEWFLPATVLLPLGVIAYWVTEAVAPKPSEIGMLVLYEVVFLSWTYVWKVWPWVRLDGEPRARNRNTGPDA